MSLDPDAANAADSASDHPEAPPTLSMTVVEYSGEPDRCTVSPEGLSGLARLSTWLTVDRSVVVDLSSMR
ncbi:DUF7511 domain-containing protein [Haloarcula salina]|uniref:DUF7511 domain-containing protein n=1 Tax=Haloarcula salina TaxID=1429914 RepID=UPI003C6EFAC8